MLQIMIACRRTGQFVPTGIETDIDTFIALPEALSLTRCPACGGNHYWTKNQTWICNIESSSRALLPAEIKTEKFEGHQEGWRSLWLAIAGVIAIMLIWNVVMLSLNGISY